jgi:hypothetical protein
MTSSGVEMKKRTGFPITHQPSLHGATAAVLRVAAKPLVALVACSPVPLPGPTTPNQPTGVQQPDASGTGPVSPTTGAGGTAPGAASGGAPAAHGESSTQRRPINLVPGQVSDHFPIQSSGNSVTLKRMDNGEWNLRMSVVPRKAAEESWAGYCWALSAVDGRPHENLKVRFSQIAKPQELQFKLEKKDNRFQDRALRIPVVGDVLIPVSNFPTVQGSIGRFCLVLAAPIGTLKTVEAEVTMAEVLLE